MRTIDADIAAGVFQPVYLLYGEEAYLKNQYKKKLQEALSQPGDTMNAAYFEGKNINPGEIIDLAETLPFFAEHRLILIENSGVFKHPCEALADYMKEIAGTACFVFVEEEVDRRSKMYKAVKKAGRAVEFPRQGEKVLVQWILMRLKKEKKKITQPVMQLFLEKAENDMGHIDRELEKLFCYTMGREAITAEDVEAVCVSQATGKVFEMVDNIVGKRQEKALDLYYDLLALKEPPMRILFLIARQFRILYLVKGLRSQGYGQKAIASKAGIPEFAVRKNLAQAEKLPVGKLKGAVADCVQAEEDVKTGRLNDRLAVELLIVKYSQN
ncbi:MAG: DNA polymerase III subunit delta [Lachnospiraceae bacterium]|nr:DNA polymerase III subunit delta [Lachnospiraceae bacterium]